MVVTIIVFLFILSILVLVHELGHFLVAKKLGVKVEEFGFGFPPRILGKKIGETLYSVNLLPIGGFVKLFGEDDAGGGRIGSSKNAKSVRGKQLERAFFARPMWQRAAIIIAGVAMNFLLAFGIITYLFAVSGVPSIGNQVYIVSVAKNSPAQKAGLVIGDRVSTFDHVAITSASELIELTKKHIGQTITLEIITSKKNHETVTLIPRLHYPANEGAIGIGISPNIVNTKYPWYEAPIVGIRESLQESWMIVLGLESTVIQLVVQRSVPEGIAGPVGIAQLTGQFVQIGPDAVLSFISLLSLNLAIVNVLPIPALDGGRLFFIFVEAITRKKIASRYEGYAHTVGMVLLLALVLAITLHDIIRLVNGQSILPK